MYTIRMSGIAALVLSFTSQTACGQTTTMPVVPESRAARQAIHCLDATASADALERVEHEYLKQDPDTTHQRRMREEGEKILAAKQIELVQVDTTSGTPVCKGEAHRASDEERLLPRDGRLVAVCVDPIKGKCIAYAIQRVSFSGGVYTFLAEANAATQFY